MSYTQDTIAQRITNLRHEIAEVCRRCGRDPASVTLMGVSKFHPPTLVIEAVRAGLLDFGENYVQELLAKAPVVQQEVPEVRWHFIGGLQSNKAARLVPLVSSIQSLDRPRLISKLSSAGQLDVFIEVNIGQEQQKHGISPKDTPAFTREILNTPYLRLAGLMTIPPITDNPEDSRPYFSTLRNLRDQIRNDLQLPPDLLMGLSMGMSHDFAVAIEEGATIIRVGTAIFGQRKS